MDAKDLRTEAALGDRSNECNTKYTQGTGGSALLCPGNKTYQDIGSGPLGKVDGPPTRPCAVIGPDRVVPPPVSCDAYMKKNAHEPWLSPEIAYRRPPEYPHKLLDYQHTTRNISPRQTFQENMQRIMVQPSYSASKLKEDHSFPGDISQMRNNKLNGPIDPKYCDVPYTVNSITGEQKNIRSSDISVSNMNSVLTRSVPHGWPPTSSNIGPPKTYRQDVPPYPEYQNCVGPRPMLMTKSHRVGNEEPGPMFPEAYYHDPNIRFKPYPTAKERYPQSRYEYIGNYSNPFHPPPPFPTHKYDMQKPLPPHPYPSYPQVPLKYLESRITDPIINGYQRPFNPQVNYSTMPFRNQVIHSTYGPVPGNCIPPNKYYPYSEVTKPLPSNKLPYDPNSKIYPEYEGNRNKNYPMPDSFYINDINRPHPTKGGLPPNYPSNIHAMPTHAFYRKEPLKGYDYSPHFRNMEPNVGMSGNPMSRIMSQFSPTAIGISSLDPNASNDTNHTQGILQEDFGYVSQSSIASGRSVDSGFSKIHPDFYRRYEQRFNPALRNSIGSPKADPIIDNNTGPKSKKNIDVRQFLQMWNESEDEGGDSNNKEIMTKTVPHQANDSLPTQEQNKQELYVLGLVNVPSEELSKYEHIQKVSKLPENIKGYNSVELLHQFEEAVEFSNLNNYITKSPNNKEVHNSMKGTITMHGLGIPSRPISPLDVEAKISQSVIHKDVGCNFEIKPCSPKMLNVEVATPVQTILGERVIEKVSNPLTIQSPIMVNLADNRELCNMIDSKEYHSENVASCKMINKLYGNKDIVDIAKTNYSIQDLESNSGVCLASLPRLDNDIELNFPEVNQQFINANKSESVITSAPIKDLPPLDTDHVNEMPTKLEASANNSTTKNNVETDFSKLSKYRKLKRKGSRPSTPESNVQAQRTDSVIIKNPENCKSNANFEKSYSPQSNAAIAQDDPINLSVNTEYRENFLPTNDDVNIPIKPNDFAIDFSVNSIESCDLPNSMKLSKTEPTEYQTPSSDNLSKRVQRKKDCSEKRSKAVLIKNSKVKSDDNTKLNAVEPNSNNQSEYNKYMVPDMTKSLDNDTNSSSKSPRPQSSDKASEIEKLDTSILDCDVKKSFDKTKSFNVMINPSPMLQLKNEPQCEEKSDGNIIKNKEQSLNTIKHNDSTLITSTKIKSTTLPKDLNVLPDSDFKQSHDTIKTVNMQQDLSPKFQTCTAFDFKEDQNKTMLHTDLEKSFSLTKPLYHTPNSLQSLKSDLKVLDITISNIKKSIHATELTNDDNKFPPENESDLKVLDVTIPNLEKSIHATKLTNDDNKFPPENESDLKVLDVTIPNLKKSIHATKLTNDDNKFPPENEGISENALPLSDLRQSFDMSKTINALPYSFPEIQSYANPECKDGFKTAVDSSQFDDDVDAKCVYVSPPGLSPTLLETVEKKDELNVITDSNLQQSCDVTESIEKNLKSSPSPLNLPKTNEMLIDKIPNDDCGYEKNSVKSNLSKSNLPAYSQLQSPEREDTLNEKMRQLFGEDLTNADNLTLLNKEKVIENKNHAFFSNEEVNRCVNSDNNNSQVNHFDLKSKETESYIEVSLQFKSVVHDKYVNECDDSKSNDAGFTKDEESKRKKYFKHKENKERHAAFNHKNKKELLSPWIQKLIIHDEGPCKKISTSSGSVHDVTSNKATFTTNDYENYEKVQGYDTDSKDDDNNRDIKSDRNICTKKQKIDNYEISLNPDRDTIEPFESNGESSKSLFRANYAGVCIEDDQSLLINSVENNNSIQETKDLVTDSINEVSFFEQNQSFRSKEENYINSADENEEDLLEFPTQIPEIGAMLSPFETSIDSHDVIVDDNQQLKIDLPEDNIQNCASMNVSVNKENHTFTYIEPAVLESENNEKAFSSDIISTETDIVTKESLYTKNNRLKRTKDEAPFNHCISDQCTHEGETSKESCNKVFTETCYDCYNEQFEPENPLQIRDLTVKLSKTKKELTDEAMFSSDDLTSCSAFDGDTTSRIQGHLSDNKDLCPQDESGNEQHSTETARDDQDTASISTNAKLSPNESDLDVNGADNIQIESDSAHTNISDTSKQFDNDDNIGGCTKHVKSPKVKDNNDEIHDARVFLNETNSNTELTFNSEIKDISILRLNDHCASEKSVESDIVIQGDDSVQLSTSETNMKLDNNLAKTNVVPDSGDMINDSGITIENFNEYQTDVNDEQPLENYENVRYSARYCNKRRKSLKRSLSDSALDEIRDSVSEESDSSPPLWPNKRKRNIEVSTGGAPHIFAQNICHLIHNNRRNSVSSYLHNEENVYILIDNNCLISECNESDKICIPEVTENCLPCLQEEPVDEESSDNFLADCKYSASNTHFTLDDKSIDEPWVEDVACVETVVTDDIAEDIVISTSPSPKGDEDTEEEDEATVYNINEHTDKLKFIYGEKIVSDDTHFMDTLYRTPQMNVNRTLNNRESQTPDECGVYYDKESLEKVLSANCQEDTSTASGDLNYRMPVASPQIYEELPNNADNLNLDSCNMYRPKTPASENEGYNSDNACDDTNFQVKDNFEMVRNDETKKTSIVHSCESSVDDVFTYKISHESPISSSPEVSSTTSEEKNSGILLKITNYGGSRVSQVNDISSPINRTSCKYTEKKDYLSSINNSKPRTLITKAAQKYIPPIKDSIHELKVKLPLPPHSLLKLKQLKSSKEALKPNVDKPVVNTLRKEIPKKPKPKFEDVLKSIEEMQFQKHREKLKKNRKFVPKVVIKKSENGSHYASTSSKDKYNPDLTGSKWQPWVFIEKNNLIDKMALKNKTRAIFNHRKNTFVLAEKFHKYKSVGTKFIISQPNLSNSTSGHLKYTIRLKHSY